MLENTVALMCQDRRPSATGLYTYLKKEREGNEFSRCEGGGRTPTTCYAQFCLFPSDETVAKLTSNAKEEADVKIRRV